jgi:hypothetical protein
VPRQRAARFALGGAATMGTSPLLWGSCQVGSALRSFFRCGGVFGGGGCCRSPRTPAAASGAGSGGAEPPATRFEFFLLERFLFVFGEHFFSPRANCYPQAHHQGLDACIMTYSGREEERAPSIYRSSCFGRSAAMSRVRRSKGLSLGGEKVFLLGKVPPWRAFVSWSALLIPAQVLAPALAR